jgi:hypothetical protein
MLELCRNFFITLVKTFFPFSADILIRSVKFQIWFSWYYIGYNIGTVKHTTFMVGKIMCKQLLGLRAHLVSLLCSDFFSTGERERVGVGAAYPVSSKKDFSIKSISTDVTRLVPSNLPERNYTILNTYKA